ncbi:FGGY-family carbohydrate kinase [Stackebrandtia nassauensis]|uniref:Carbohydrate kinase FGGY n=1 Tax=Stackebrandtia nassauensis (strain DSM 44728 / CIP 108903 / NRRL B-16338 / NBRC 102104 / LLR-40K-21) TaxID=446470 RepID=D3Q0X0_STANL|nr:FGGY-family carbohydrate kinase [Stackebrandtia nassauensis]ADD43720.1 carbohydrate kinase FGGY [Stackebrandtia nassauensis DSM 44728]
MYLGIDIGTSVTKAAAFDDDGRLVAVKGTPTRMSTPAEGFYEQDIDEVVASVAEVAAATATAAGGIPTAIGLTGQGDGVWLVDADGQAVRPAISWMDGRAASILTDWLADGTVAKAFRRTGNTMFPGSAGPILAWLDQHEPESLDRAATAGYCKDVVMQRLTGVRATDTSDASLPFLDPATRRYDPEVLEWCGIGHRASLLAPVAEPLPVGKLTDAAAARLGLPSGITVTSGPFDLPACALGSGIVTPGDGHLIIGTTLACQVLVDHVDTDVEPNGLTLATGTPNRWLRAMPAMVGTAAVDWVLKLIGRDHQALETLLADSPLGARGVTCLPFFSPAGERAPFLEPAARAGFDRVTIQTEPSDLVRATCEAVAFAARHCFEAAGLTGELAMCGGGTASPTWLKIFADVLNRPLKLAPQPETGARGAALAARRIAEPAASLSEWTTPEGVVEPDPIRAAEYEHRYAAYRARVDAARLTWKEAA